MCMLRAAPLTHQGRLKAGLGLLSIGLLLTLTGCGSLPKSEAEAQQRSGRQGQQGQQKGPASVDVIVAQTSTLSTLLEYTGTTQPSRLVSLRTQAEGQLLSLSVDVGDPVAQGQVLARLDDTVLSTAVIEAQAEAAALESGVAQARTEVSDALNQVERSRLELQQARADQVRFEQLYQAGAVPKQQAEQARTTADTLEQTLRSAQQAVRTRQQAVTAAARRVAAQRAVTAREQERLSYAVLSSPVNGVVLEKIAEPGNLAQTGSEILKLGDFSQVKVSVQVSELELGQIRTGQAAQVKLDAFPTQQFQGQVTRVSPVADPTARLIPVEVTIPNAQGRIGSGLLARVSFGQARTAVVVPEAALQTNRERRGGGRGARGNRGAGGSQASGGRSSGELSSGTSSNGGSSARPDSAQPDSQTGSQPRPNRGGSADGSASRAGSGRSGSSPSGADPSGATTGSTGTLFTVTGSGAETKVVARRVTLGTRRDGNVEVLSGLRAGDRLVTRSSKALKDGDPVRLSAISEGRGNRGEGSRSGRSERSGGRPPVEGDGQPAGSGRRAQRP